MRRMISLSALLLLAAAMGAPGQCAGGDSQFYPLGDPFADRVVSVSYGSSAGHGQDQMPGIVLGPPEGEGELQGSLHVCSLGDGGQIVLSFEDNLVLDGPGPDLLIFENAFYVAGNPENVFAEVAKVAVSQDGEVWLTFPCDYDAEAGPPGHPDCWTGFAGEEPVFSNSFNGLDPTDPEAAGGDPFDLAEVGLSWIRFVRISDTDEGAGAQADDDGDPIWDPGNPGGNMGGFDLDGVSAIHWEPRLVKAVPACGPAGLLALVAAFTALVVLRRRS